MPSRAPDLNLRVPGAKAIRPRRKGARGAAGNDGWAGRAGENLPQSRHSCPQERAQPATPGNILDLLETIGCSCLLLLVFYLLGLLSGRSSVQLRPEAPNLLRPQSPDFAAITAEIDEPRRIDGDRADEAEHAQRKCARPTGHRVHLRNPRSQEDAGRHGCRPATYRSAACHFHSTRRKFISPQKVRNSS